ncbi:MAG: hypothetical protein JO255_04150 [Alphaproteobacteria bacterium]|nr:hypothetical protein [Alphaproteobacteria bacterium]
MSRIKSPDEKKRLSLARDHRTFPLEGNKSFRSAWRLKKARSNRQFRRKGKVVLEGAVQVDPGALPEAAGSKPKRALKKYGVTSLAQSIGIKNDRARSRWGLGISTKNPDALKAALRRKGGKAKA